MKMGNDLGFCEFSTGDSTVVENWPPPRTLTSSATHSRLHLRARRNKGEPGEVQSTPAQKRAGGARIIDTTPSGFKT